MFRCAINATPRSASVQQCTWGAAPHSSRVRPFTKTRVRSVSTTQSTAPGLAPMQWQGTPEQLQALQQLRTRMAAGLQECPDEETLKWYLRDRYFDVNEAEQKLKATLAWRHKFKADHITLDDVKAEYATGKSIVHDKLDKYGRPVLVIKACRHNSGEFPLDNSKRLCVYSLDTALRKLPPGGEQILGVIDLKDMKLSNIDMLFVAFMVDAFFVYYPRRMGQVLLVDAPWIFKGPWELIKPLLRKYAALVRFVSREELARDFFTTDTLPADFRS